MAFWRIFDTEGEVMDDIGKGLTNERITELAIFRMMRTNEMVKKQEEVIKKLLKKHPVNKS